MIEVILNDRLGTKVRVKCKCVGRGAGRERRGAGAARAFQIVRALTLLPPPRSPDDTVGDLKKLAAAQTGNRPEKLRIQKWYTIYKDHITLEDCACRARVLRSPLRLTPCARSPRGEQTRSTTA